MRDLCPIIIEAYAIGALFLCLSVGLLFFAWELFNAVREGEEGKAEKQGVPGLGHRLILKEEVNDIGEEDENKAKDDTNEAGMCQGNIIRMPRVEQNDLPSEGGREAE